MLLPIYKAVCLCPAHNSEECCVPDLNVFYFILLDSLCSSNESPCCRNGEDVW